MDLQSWAAFAAIFGALIANYVMMARSIDRLSKKIDVVHDELSARIEAVRDELSTRIEDVRSELTTRIEDVRTELSIRIDHVRDELATRLDAVRDELKSDMRTGFSTAEGRLITLEQRTYDLSSRLPNTARHTG